MKITIGVFILLCILSGPAQGSAATIYLNDGRIVETDHISQEDGWVKCRINGITIQFAVEDIDRVEGAAHGLQSKGDATRPNSAPDVQSNLIKGCYELGYRYGMCAAKRHHNIRCERKNDIAIPQRCRGKSETEKGMVFGIAEISVASKTPSGPSVASLSINLESTPIETLQKHLSGKTKQEVTDLVGKPNSVKHYAGHELWVYVDSMASNDKAVAFQGEIVKAVVLY